MPTVVIAPDSFKGSATAADAAAAIAAGWRSVRPDDHLIEVPMADGGEGTLEAFARSVPGAIRHPREVSGPVRARERIRSEWLELPPTPARPHRTAVVELAAAAGLTLLDEPAPLTAHTRAVGELIAAALDGGVDEVLVALGGSASTDGGAGALAALGARIVDADGRDLPEGGGALGRVAAVDLADLRPLPSRGVRLLTDVDSPLLGPLGAAAVFAPQKGADADVVLRLAASLAAFAAVAGGDPLARGSGAAGGTAYGLSLWGAVVSPGAPAVAAAVGLAEHLTGADLVITGEGSFDVQTDAGKAPRVVLDLAARAGAETCIIAGRVDRSAVAGTAISLSELAGSGEAAMRDPLAWLREAGAEAARVQPPEVEVRRDSTSHGVRRSRPAPQ